MTDNKKSPEQSSEVFCVRRSCGKAAMYTKPSSPKQASEYSGSPNRKKLFLTLCILLIVSSAAIASGKSDNSSDSDSPAQFDGTKKSDSSASESEEPTKSETMPSIWETVINGQRVEVSGKIRHVGNEPLSFLVISDSADKDWYLDEKGMTLLKSYEQKPVTIKGTVELKEMILANGKNLGTRRILTEISIIR